MNSKQFGKYMKEIREDSGFATKAELSRASGVSEPTISRIERGKTGNPDIATLRALAKVLKAPEEDLVRKAGYLPEEVSVIEGNNFLEGLTPSEVEKMIEYKKFLVSSRKK